MRKGIALVLKGFSSQLGRANARTLREVLDNLVSNALKFSARGSTVAVVCGEREGEVTVGIRDQGPGLTEADKDRMFQRFGTLSAQPTGDETSTGLGLYTSKVLCDAMGARIEVESEAGRGAVFRVVMPAEG